MQTILLGPDIDVNTVTIRVGATPVRIDLFGVNSLSDCQLQFGEVVMTGGDLTLDSIDCGCSAVITEPLVPTYVKPYSVHCCERVFLDSTRTYLYLSRPGLVRMTLVGSCPEATVIATDAPTGFVPSPAEQGCCSGTAGSGGAPICEQVNALPAISFGPSDPFPSFNFVGRSPSNQCFRYDSSIFQKLNNFCANFAATPLAPTTFTGTPVISFAGYEANSGQCYRFTLDQVRGDGASACTQLAALPTYAPDDPIDVGDMMFFARLAGGSCVRSELPGLAITGTSPFLTLVSDPATRYSIEVQYNAANFTNAVASSLSTVATESPTLAAPMTMRVNAANQVRKAPFAEFGRAIPNSSTAPVRLIGQDSSGDLISVELVTIELRDCAGVLLQRFLAVNNP